MMDMNINASISSGILASSLQQQALGAQLIDKTLQQSAAAAPSQVSAANPPHKGNELNIYV
ncbi:MAG: hypothetical protein FWH34_05915 [Desulfovibrionaceae bacterium]|nr:hypothetical protein [Desulfovibrionaceae bacterium]